MEEGRNDRLKIFLFLVVILSVISLIIINSPFVYAEQEAPKPNEDVEEEMELEEEEEELGEEIKVIEPGEMLEEAPVTPTLPKAERKPGEVSFFFDDADVYEVIQTIFGEVLKVNYIVDPKVKGRVNFRTTTPIPKDEVLPAMEIVLRLNGIAVVEERGLYRILSIGDVPREPAPIYIGRDPEAVVLKGVAIIQVVQLRYISSSEIINILTPLLSQGSSIVDVPPNFMIIADTDANIKRLLQVVQIFDSESLKLVKPQVFVYPVQNSKAKDVADMLKQIFLGEKAARRPTTTPKTTTAPETTAPRPQTSVAPEGGEALVSEITKIFADEVTNTIIILATPEDFEIIAETIKKIDIVPRQVVIEGLIVRVNLTDNLNFGFAWSLNTDVNISGIRPFSRDINLGGDVTINLAGLDESNLPSRGFTFVARDPTDTIRAVITALAEEAKAKVLAAPHILVADNREARIQVGSQIPIVTSSSVIPVGGVEAGYSTTSTIQYKDIGIILKVKPQVNESGLVALELTQEISSVGEVVEVGGLKEISIDKTEASTNLVAQNGETIIIGGLIREDITKSRHGIPILNKIPIIGNLFGSTVDESKRTELIILLTPHVMRSLEEAKDVTSEYVDKFSSTTEIKKEELIKEKGIEQEKEENLPPKPPLP